MIGMEKQSHQIKSEELDQKHGNLGDKNITYPKFLKNTLIYYEDDEADNEGASTNISSKQSINDKMYNMVLEPTSNGKIEV